MQMCISVILEDPLHCIGQQNVDTSKLLGCYSSAMRRSILGQTTDLPHFSLHQRMDTLILCNYCWTTMPIWMRATVEETPYCIAQRLEVSSRLLSYCSNSISRSIPGTTRDRPRYT